MIFLVYNHTKKIMRLRKNFICYLLSIAIVLIGFSHYTFMVNASEMTEEEFYMLAKAQEEAVKANDVLMNSYLVDGILVFPDEYAGTYIENNILVIELVNNDPQVLKKYNDLLSDFKCVEYRFVDYSYNHLVELMSEVVEEVDLQYTVTSYYIDVQDNCACIEIANQEASKVATEYSRKRNRNTDCISFRDGEIFQRETHYIRGGMGINNGTNAASAGFAGYYAGKPAFLTCGHDLQIGQRIYEGDDTNNLMGRIVYHRLAEGDFSIVETTGEYQVYPTSVGSTNVTGVTYFPTVGTYVYKHGAAGGVAYCQVTETGASVGMYVSSGEYELVTNMTRASLISGNSSSGDSGGPVRTYNQFCGIHSSYSEYQGTIAFTPYGVIKSTGFDSQVG